MRTTHPGIIVPEKLPTSAVHRGRSILGQILDRTLELVDRGKTPTRIIISTGLKQDMQAFFAQAFDQYDGSIPDMCGLKIEFEPGAARDIEIQCSEQSN